ncbi:MAG: GDYXXLXY domain-containing protein [Lysobacteraceae bacterium]
MSRLRNALLWGGLLLALAVVNHGVVKRERIRAEGRPLLLALAPVDPRALMQGDYMALSYAAQDGILDALHAGWRCSSVVPNNSAAALRCLGDRYLLSPGYRDCGREGCHDGYAVFAVDADDVGRFLRVQPAPRPVAAGEVAVRFRERDWFEIRIAGNAWFFPEGQGARYAPARYGELRVDADGTALLVGLRDDRRKPL